MWVKFIPLFLLNLISLGFFSQTNLVTNPSYELCNPCPTITGQYNLCNNWLNCNGNIGQGLWGTPDYYNTCGTFNALYNPVPPNTALGVCNPHTGNAMMGLVCYNTPYPNYREYLSNHLSCPMNPGETYTVSFWINCGTTPKVKYNISNFGVYLSNTMPPQVGFNLINVTPQFEVTTIISNTSWAQYSFTINPTATFNYITLGCFKPDNMLLVSLATPTAQNPYANWYVDDIQVIANTNFQVNIVTTNASCNASNGSATITPISGSYTYTWLPGNQSTNSASNLSSGNYTVLMSNGCLNDTKTVTINNSSAQTVTINSATICAPSSVTLTANVVGGSLPYTYLWSNGGTNPTNVILANSTTVLTCTVTDNSGCVSVKNSTIALNNVQSDFVYSMNSCNGKIFTTNNSVGATTYTWNFGDGFYSNNISQNHSYTSPGTYTVTLTSANGNNCIDSVKKVVVVNAVSNSAFSLTSVMCDSTVNLINASIGSNSFVWDFGDGFVSTSQNPNSHIYSSPGVYTVTLISDPSGPCPDTSTKVVSINYNSIANFSVYVDPCNRGIQITNLSVNTNDFLWNFGNAVTSTVTNPSYVYPNNSINSYTVQLIVNNGSSCADTFFKDIKINDLVLSDFTYTTDPCTGTTRFTSLNLTAGSYYWLFNGKTASYDMNPTYHFTSNGLHQVRLICNYSGVCPDTANKLINVNVRNVKADFDFINPDLSYDLQFINKSTNGVYYLWDFNDGYATTTENPTHTFFDLKNVRICLSAKNSVGCGDTICKDIHIKLDWTLYLPNTFTPDLDGTNDLFFALATNIQQFEISIFDRWGEEIFKTDDISKGWDGSYRGKPVQEDVYVWKVNFTDLYSKRHQLVGHVSIIK